MAGFNWSLRSTPEYPTMHRAGPGAVHCWILRHTPERPIEPYSCDAGMLKLFIIHTLGGSSGSTMTSGTNRY